MPAAPRGNPNQVQHTPTIGPPAFLENPLVWAGFAAAFLIPFFLPIAQSLRRHPIIGALGDKVHIPLLGLLTLLIYWKGPLRGRLWASAAAAAVLGALIEFVQKFVGRSPLFEDWLMDLVGIGLVVGFVLWRGHQSRPGKWLFIFLLILIPAQLWYLPFSVLAKYEAQLTFPIIADFDGKHFKWLWDETNGSEMTFGLADPQQNNVLRITGGPPRRWPGARVFHFPHDWTGKTDLILDARVAAAAGDSLRFGVRVDDFMGRMDSVWASQSFIATRQWQTFTMNVADRTVQYGDRILDLGDVESVLIFVGSPKDSFTLEIDNIRLQ